MDFVKLQESFDDEELPFQQVRNAMLVLTQHGLVNCHPFRQSQDGKCHVQARPDAPCAAVEQVRL